MNNTIVEAKDITVKVRGKNYGSGNVTYEKYVAAKGWVPITTEELRKMERSGIPIWMNP